MERKALGIAAAITAVLSLPAASVAAPFFEQVSPTPTSYVLGIDWERMAFSAPATIAGEIAAPTGSSLGCNASDFTGFTPGRIALVERSTCLFREKAENALAAGAAGLIVYAAAESPELFIGTLNAPLLDFVAISTSRDVGLALIGQTVPVIVEISTVPTPGTLGLLAGAVVMLSLLRIRAGREPWLQS